MELQLKIVGTLLVLLGMLHFVFPRYFNWKMQLSSLSLINRQLMYVHTFFIAFVVFFMGVLCISSSTDLLKTALGKQICLFLGVFWSVRLFVQFFGYSSKLWRGKLFETMVHIFFTMLWIYLSMVFISAYCF
jgi:hypothetical protein